MDLVLSAEQQKFVDWSLMGVNVLVDACIGSGKTTAIQALCREASKTKRVLYLTYNKLLKLDAQNKIRGFGNTLVTNYHGFAFMELSRIGVRCGYSDIMTMYKRYLPKPQRFDLMVLDEYQDIDQDIADLLQHLKTSNPKMQIVAVGDMDQKIYDNTKLDVSQFIVDFLGEDYKPVEFTQCFRLNKQLAAQLGQVWEKSIVGVNDQCEVLVMPDDDVYDFVSQTCMPKDLLVLGSKGGRMSELQNRLEEFCPTVFNKYTVWSKIMDQDGGATQPSPDCAVFTTYDGSKGMERDVCVIYDWTEGYWNARMRHDSSRYEIIRNIFCVAASRGKKTIIFVENPRQGKLLTFSTIRKTGVMRATPKKKFNASDMFDYKYQEDIEECYALLDTEQVQPPEEVINAPLNDGLIDLSPCIGNFQEASFFKRYDIDTAVQHCMRTNQGELIQKYNTSGWSLFGKVLYLTALETNQARYVSQVRWDFLQDWVRDAIHERLGSMFDGDEVVQVPCNIEVEGDGYGPVRIDGICDVLPNNIVYELKFVSSLSHVHFLQCATYMLAMDLQDGYLWNIRDNEMWHIQIPNRRKFLNAVCRTITKGKARGAVRKPVKDEVAAFVQRHPGESRDLVAAAKNTKSGSAEAFMLSRGLVLPVDANQFIRYFGRSRG